MVGSIGALDALSAYGKARGIAPGGAVAKPEVGGADAASGDFGSLVAGAVGTDAAWIGMVDIAAGRTDFDRLGGGFKGTRQRDQDVVLAVDQM